MTTRICTKTSQTTIDDMTQWYASAQTAPHWLDVSDPTRDTLTKLGLHPLVIDDIMHGGQRTKVEYYDDYLFFVFYAFTLQSDETLQLTAIPLYICVSNQKIITIHKNMEHTIDDAWRRWHALTADTLVAVDVLHMFLDTVVDSYFPMIDVIGDAIEELEMQILSGASPAQLRNVLQLKRTLLEFRRHVAPTREALNALLRGDMLTVERQTLMQIQDVYDHVLRIIDTIDLHRDLLTSILDVHLSVQSNRLNQVMKVLTIASIILMGNSLIAGIYGMNFAQMPELSWAFGYPATLIAMALLSVGMFIYFRRRGWLSNNEL
ncbi:MAG: magnesium/cobalt transporter CorA [Roseiflexaceae bacterium]|jgi:magnesium transporter|nr:magnesium/cobalt transporter CorA [Chloroflexaceae bacterium]